MVVWKQDMSRKKATSSFLKDVLFIFVFKTENLVTKNVDNGV